MNVAEGEAFITLTPSLLIDVTYGRQGWFCCMIRESKGAHPMTQDPTKPLLIKVQVTLTENQVKILTAQAKNEHRSVSNLIQILLCEGWSWYLEDHSVYIEHPEHYEEGSGYPKKWLSDPETRDMMIPAIPDYVS